MKPRIIIVFVLLMLTATSCAEKTRNTNPEIPSYHNSYDVRVHPTEKIAYGKKKSVEFRTEDDIERVASFYKTSFLEDKWYISKEKPGYIFLMNTEGCPVYFADISLDKDILGKTLVEIVLTVEACR